MKILHIVMNMAEASGEVTFVRRLDDALRATGILPGLFGHSERYGRFGFVFA